MKLLGSNLHSHPGGPQSTPPEYAWSPLLSLPARIVGKPRILYDARERSGPDPGSRRSSDLAEGSAEADPAPARSSPFPCPSTSASATLEGTKGSELPALPCLPPSLPALRTEADPLGSSFRPSRPLLKPYSALFEARREGEGDSHTPS